MKFAVLAGSGGPPWISLDDWLEVSPGEVARVAQGHVQAAQGRVARDRRAGRATADHEHVEDVVGEPSQRGRPAARPMGASVP